jgi:hypothetical protein
MPTLIYQIVWQRALFSIFGVNAESVAVIAAAFMFGLSIGSLLGGWSSSRFAAKALVLFGISEVGIRYRVTARVSLSCGIQRRRHSSGAIHKRRRMLSQDDNPLLRARSCK